MMRKQALTDKGKAWAGVAIDDSDLLAVGERLMHALKWQGPLELELLRDAEGVLHLIPGFISPTGSDAICRWRCWD